MTDTFTPEETMSYPELAHKDEPADTYQVGGNHYKDMAVEPWTLMETILTRAEFIGFLKGNVIKYSMRQGRKDGSNDGAKALHYLKKLKEKTQ